jgi:electron transport complex protein RnfB
MMAGKSDPIKPFKHETKAPEVYYKLAELLLKTPILSGAPVTHDLVEILRMRLTEEKAAFCLNLTQAPETAEQIAKRMGRDVEETRKKMDELCAEGNLFSFNDKGTRKYCLLTEYGFYNTPIIDAGPKAIDDPFLQRIDKHWVEFTLSGGAKALWGTADTPWSRVVTIEEGIPVDFKATPAQLVSEQLKRAQKPLALTYCTCRLGRHKCDRSLDTCILVGAVAEFYIERGTGREISVEEALEIVKRSQDECLVQIVNNQQRGSYYVCNCCGCCCNILRGAQLPGPVGSIRRATARSGFIPMVDEEICNGCGVCEGVCQVKAIKTLKDEEKIVINRDMCIGCGLCGHHCPLDAITYVRDATAPDIPEDMEDLFTRISKEKGKKFDPDTMQAV